MGERPRRVVVGARQLFGVDGTGYASMAMSCQRYAPASKEVTKCPAPPVGAWRKMATGFRAGGLGWSRCQYRLCPFTSFWLENRFGFQQWLCGCRRNNANQGPCSPNIPNGKLVRRVQLPAGCLSCSVISRRSSL